MIPSLFSDTETLLAAIPQEGGELQIVHACVRGRKILSTGEGVPSQLKGVTRASVFSLESYFEQVDLAAASVKLLPLVARRHVDAELVFDDALYRLRARSRGKTERTIAADLAALPERDLETAIAQLPMHQNPCEQVVPLELAIAALVAQLTPEAALVFWEKGGVLISLLVAGGMVQNRMRELVGDGNRELVLQRANASLRTAASRDGADGNKLPALYTGELAERQAAGSEHPGRSLENRLAGLFRSGRGVPADAALRDPELYGLPFVAPEWSFLDSGYRQQVQSWRYAKPVAAAAAAAGVAIGLYGGVQHLQALNIASDFDRQRASLSAELADFERKRPSEEAMASVRDLLRVHQGSLNEVRLDRMLDWLTHLLPEDMAIKGLEMAPAPAPRQRNRVAPKPFPPGEKPFDLRLQIVLGEVSLDAAEASAAEVVKRLSQRLQMVDSRLEVPAPEPGAGRNVVLVVQAQARAVNFS